ASRLSSLDNSSERCGPGSHRYSSISGAYTPIWVAHDAGYFAKEGLQDDIILIPSGTQLAQVTVAGEIEIGSLNGSSAIAAALQGADLKIIGNSGNKMVF